MISWTWIQPLVCFYSEFFSFKNIFLSHLITLKYFSTLSNSYLFIKYIVCPLQFYVPYRFGEHSLCLIKRGSGHFKGCVLFLIPDPVDKAVFLSGSWRGVHLTLLLVSWCFFYSSTRISWCTSSKAMWKSVSGGKRIGQKVKDLGFLLTPSLHWLGIFLLLPSLKYRACLRLVFPSSFNFSSRTSQPSPPPAKKKKQKHRIQLFRRSSFQ